MHAYIPITDRVQSSIGSGVLKIGRWIRGFGKEAPQTCSVSLSDTPSSFGRDFRGLLSLGNSSSGKDRVRAPASIKRGRAAA